jgi:spermidine synthase
MIPDASRLLAIQSPFPEAHSTLRFLEPPGTCTSSLWERIFAGNYGRPFIVDSPRKRYLHFDLDAVQSAMDLVHPERLCLAYTRKMMAFLLFNRLPQRVLLLGLGGGSLAKFCYRHLQQSAITAIEKSTDVLELRDEFQVPRDDERFRVIHADAAEYVAQLSPCKDVILADACDHAGIAPQTDTHAFYSGAFRSLAPGGVFVVNLCGERHSRSAHFLRIRQVFGEQWLTLPVHPDGNIIVLAFKDRSAPAPGAQLAENASELKRAFGLDFPSYVRRIAREWQRRRTRHAFTGDGARLPVAPSRS